jgi:hypothetical protein
MNIVSYILKKDYYTSRVVTPTLDKKKEIKSIIMEYICDVMMEAIVNIAIFVDIAPTINIIILLLILIFVPLRLRGST